VSASHVPGTPRLLRAINDRAALELLLAQGPLTRARLGELTGLSKVTASQMVERLEERGLVARVGERVGGRGPNAQLYAVVPASAYVVGVEVGPGHVIAACADITGTVVGQITDTTADTDNPVGVVHRAVVRAAEAAGAALPDVRRVVLGTPGLVDPRTGDLAFAFDLPGWQRGLLGKLRADLDRPVTLENDVNLAAVAERSAGAAAGVDDFVLIWLGRGVGMAVTLGGRLHRGVSGAAGEIGYLPVAGAEVPHDIDKRARGGFMELAGGEALRGVMAAHGFPADSAEQAVAAAVAATGRAGKAVDGRPGKAVDGRAGTAVDQRAGKALEDHAEQALEELARRLALGLSSACVVLDPALVVLAGEVGRAGGAALAERVQRAVAAIAPVAPRVVASEVAANPVLHGALTTAVEAARDEVFGSMLT
jgi:predicted NBD/HSP70 family sugar kinase